MRRLALIAVLAACRPPSLPAVTDSASVGVSATTSEGGSGTTGCMHSGDCDTDAICVAAFDPTTGGFGGGHEPPACVALGSCIEALDLGRWCFDHQSCCGDLRCRTADGVCEPPDLGVSTGEATTGGDTGTTTGTTDTGTTTGTTDTGTTTGTTGTGTTDTTDTTTDTTTGTGTTTG